MDGIITSVNDEEDKKNHFKELVFHNCVINAQYHVENSDIDKLVFNFSKVGESGRLRLSQCNIGEYTAGCSSVFGQMDVVGTEIGSIDFEGSCVQGFILFQGNEVKDFTNRQTLRLLKNEALKINDNVAATRLYAKEMEMLLKDKSVSFWDKASLRLSKWFSGFGESWGRALLVTLTMSVVLTLLMLGFGSTKYAFNPTGEFMGMGSFITSLLDSINVFSIPLFSDTIKEYGLNVWGQLLYFIIKIVVAYGTYQFIMAFRKYGRN